METRNGDSIGTTIGILPPSPTKHQGDKLGHFGCAVEGLGYTWTLQNLPLQGSLL